MRPRIADSTHGVWAYARARGAWLAAVVGVACFLNSILNGFTYDDDTIIADNPRVRAPTDVSAIWLSDWWEPQDEYEAIVRKQRDRLYRPLTMQTFALNHAVTGLRPAAFHAVNVLLHALACALVWKLTQRLFRDEDVSTIAALLFAVHPVHAEAVANVVGRAEILAAIFLALGLIVLVPRARPPSVKRCLVAGGLFLLALFSKETAVCYWLLAVIVLHGVAHGSEPERWRRLVTQGGVLLAPLVVYFPLRYVALDQHLLRDRPPNVLANALVGAELPERALHALTVLGHYVRLLFVPQELGANYGLAVIDPERSVELLTVVGALAGLGLIVTLLGYRQRAGTWRRLALCSALFAASYALISNTVLLIGVTVAERLMYWPSVPVLIGTGVGLVHLWRRADQAGRLTAGARRLLPVCGVALLAALGLRTVVRSADWYSERTLFLRDVQVFPRSAELNYLAAKELLRDAGARFKDVRLPVAQEQTRLADKATDLATRVTTQPGNAALRREYGETLLRQGATEEALAELAAALRLAPGDQELRRLLHEAQRRAAFFEALDAVDAYADHALEIHPAFPAARQLRGRVLALRGEREAAIRNFEAALRLAPLDRAARDLLTRLRREADGGRVDELAARVTTRPADAGLRLEYGRALLQRGQSLAALEHLREAASLTPDNPEVLSTLGVAYAHTNQRQEAIKALRRAVELAPESWEPRVNLAGLLVGQDEEEALRHVREAVRLASDNLEAQLVLAEALAGTGRTDAALERYRLIRRGLPEDDPLREQIEERIRALEQARRP